MKQVKQILIVGSANARSAIEDAIVGCASFECIFNSVNLGSAINSLVSRRYDIIVFDVESNPSAAIQFVVDAHRRGNLVYVVPFDDVSPDYYRHGVLYCVGDLEKEMSLALVKVDRKEKELAEHVKDNEWALLTADFMTKMGFTNVRACYPASGALYRSKECVALGELPLSYKDDLMVWFRALKEGDIINHFSNVFYWGKVNASSDEWQCEITSWGCSNIELSLCYGKFNISVDMNLGVGDGPWLRSTWKALNQDLV